MRFVLAAGLAKVLALRVGDRLGDRLGEGDQLNTSQPNEHPTFSLS
jgi:hypothetical protein